MLKSFAQPLSGKLQHVVEASAAHIVARIAASHHLTRCFSSHSGGEYYDLLGVDKKASSEEIKAAFKQKVKALHPDLNNGQFDTDLFCRTLTAYDTLITAEKRQQYDVLHDSSQPEVLRAAAASQFDAGRSRQSSSTVPPEPLRWRYGWDAWGESGPLPPAVDTHQGMAAVLYKYRQDLESNLHAALLHAYFGPKLSVALGELPECFELEERSNAMCSNELIHIVSGRTMLGMVREAPTTALEGGSLSSRHMLPAGTSPSPAPSYPAGSTSPALPHHSTMPARSQVSSLQRSTASFPLRSHQQEAHVCGTMGADRLRAQWVARQKAASIVAAAQPNQSIDQHSSTNCNTTRTTNSNTTHFTSSTATHITASNTNHFTDSNTTHGTTSDATHSMDSSAAHVTNSNTAHFTVSHMKDITDSYAAHSSNATHAESLPQQDPSSAASHSFPTHTLPSTHDFVQMGPVTNRQTSMYQVHHEAFQETHQATNLEQPTRTDHHSEVSPLGATAAQQHNQNRHQSFGAASAVQHAGLSHRHCEGQTPLGTAKVPRDAAGPPLDSAGPQQQTESGQQDCEVPSLGAAMAEGALEGLSDAVRAFLGLPQVDHTGHTGIRQEEESVRMSDEEASGNTWGQHESAAGACGSAREHTKSAGADEFSGWSVAQAVTGAEAHSDGVCVLELRLLGDMAPVACAVRAEALPERPVKVVMDGRVVICRYKNLLLDPTGQTAATLTQYHTPGVHHVYVYRRQKPARRLLCRATRAWLPPSDTWLFSPRSDAHDIGGWYVEWEGHKRQDLPGWIHPAALVLLLSFEALDRENKARSSTVYNTTPIWLKDGMSSASELWNKVQAWIQSWQSHV